MATFNDIINLAKADGGKFFVIDESGDAKLVIMSTEDYQRLLLGKLRKQIKDVEAINKEIIKAQLHEDIEQGNLKGLPRSDQRSWSGTGAQMQEDRQTTAPAVPTPKKLASRPMVDLREEVIDPSFDFDGPKIGIDDL